MTGEMAISDDNDDVPDAITNIVVAINRLQTRIHTECPANHKHFVYRFLCQFYGLFN